MISLQRLFGVKNEEGASGQAKNREVITNIKQKEAWLAYAFFTSRKKKQQEEGHFIHKHRLILRKSKILLVARFPDKTFACSVRLGKLWAVFGLGKECISHS